MVSDFQTNVAPRCLILGLGRGVIQTSTPYSVSIQILTCSAIWYNGRFSRPLRVRPDLWQRPNRTAGKHEGSLSSFLPE